MVRYSDELIDEIRASNDIVDVISQYVTLKRSGRNFFGLCPFHKEKSPSFSVSPDKQIFHCFGCGVGGNVIHFISKIDNIDFRETLEVLAERAGITLPTLENNQDNKLLELKAKVYDINKDAAYFYHENLYKPTSKEAQEYIKKRKLGNNTLKSFLIGYSGNYDELYKMLKAKGYTENEILASSLVNKTENGKFVDRFRKRLMFPILDVRGRVIAFGGRVLDDSKPKYINSPENVVYSKGRHLFGLNVAKKEDLKKIIIVEGYMDVISLHQRGVTNVVASLGTALTEAQGRLLRKHSQQVILGYDSDGAGQAATVRGLEILQSMGADVRILQIEGAKDPDEYIINFGSARFLKAVENSISLVEYKVKMLKNTLNTDNTSDKIKFLNEIAKILSKVDNNIEKEIYIDKISDEYKISKEAIHAEINKLKYKKEEPIKKVNYIPKTNSSAEVEISPAIIRRENMIISLLINPENDTYEKLKNVITLDDFKFEKNKKIAEKIYKEYENGNSINIENNILNSFADEEIINHITEILADDFEISDVSKCIEDLLNIYTKEKVIDERNEILKALENETLTKEEKTELEAALREVIIKLAKMK